MAIHIDNFDDSLIIDGWENGIADSPFNGISDIKNVNIISVPGEASVNFATATATPPYITGISVVSADAGTDIITISSTPTLLTYMAVIFSGASLPAGIAAGTIYWVNKQSDTTIKIYDDYKMTSLVDITGNGTGSMSTIEMGIPTYFASSINYDWMLDDNGRVWSNSYMSGDYWTNTGNKPNNTSNGEGLVIYEASDRTEYLFVFSGASIDFASLPGLGTVLTWYYQWDPSAGTVGVWSNTPTAILKSQNYADMAHEAFVAPDSRVYFCDKNWIGRFYQTSPTTAFDPLDVDSFTFDQTQLLPTTDVAQCLTYLGVQVLVGGKKNVIYPWNRYSTNFDTPILISENDIKKMVTVNTNTFIFAGNRGRIYITNGSQAQVYKKIPDHISGSVEPYYTWYGACTNKNQLYFSFRVRLNGGVGDISGYGGVWAIDLDTQAMRLSNKLSFNNYYGYATALSAISGVPDGVGLLIGWNDGGTGGIDKTLSTPYTNSQATIDTDLIPIGTFDNPRNFTRIEYRLTKPMVSGESITIKYRKDFSQSYTTIFTDSTAGHFSASESVNFENAQWIQFQVVLNSTATNPSFTRLKEIRLKGLIGEVPATSQQISI